MLIVKSSAKCQHFRRLVVRGNDYIIFSCLLTANQTSFKIYCDIIIVPFTALVDASTVVVRLKVFLANAQLFNANTGAVFIHFFKGRI